MLAGGSASCGDRDRDADTTIDAPAEGAAAADAPFGEDGFFTWGDPTDDRQRGLSIVRQADGRLVAAAISTTMGDYVDVVRLTSTGAVDPSFGGHGTGHALVDAPPYSRSAALAADPGDGSLYVIVTSSSRFETTLVRLDPQGVRDASFGDGGIVRLPATGYGSDWAVAVRPDGKVVAAAGSTVRRFERDGTADLAFGDSGVATITSVALEGAIAFDADGNVLAGGFDDAVATAFPRAAIVKLLANGAVDASFGEGGVARVPDVRTIVGALAVGADGRIVAGGAYGRARASSHDSTQRAASILRSRRALPCSPKSP